MIDYQKEKRIIHLHNEFISYYMYISEDDALLHLYFGKKIKEIDLDTLLYRTENYDTHYDNGKEDKVNDYMLNPESSLCEMPGFGIGDYRFAAIKIKNHYGDSTTDFRFQSLKIYKGKKEIQGLPQLHGHEEDFETVEITMFDKVTLVSAILSFTILKKYPVIARSMKIINTSNQPILLQHATSLTLDIPHDNYQMYYLAGIYGKERTIHHQAVTPGTFLISCLEGKSSHHDTPFLALASKEVNEDYGEVIATQLIYSGNFEIRVEDNPLFMIRLSVGINPETFEYHLDPQESFQTPEAILQYTTNGLNGMSQGFHHLFLHHLIEEKWANVKRPLLINSWEGTYFSFDTAKIIHYAKEAKKLGIEMLVLDDGWFGKRDNDSCSLGDWFVNEDKIHFPELIKALHELDLKFGLWFEPEMICPDSDLYRAHPEYAIASKNRRSTLMRHQMMLDMSKPEVVEALYLQMSQLLDTYPIDYIKWDHNRSITEAFSSTLSYEKMGEFYHRFILGTYTLLNKLKTNYPDVLIETCCGGGGRYDAGMLYYGPQIWTSDNTDPIERLTIQEGTSFAFPPSSMGAHVSASDRTSYQTKGIVAMQGTFGYELNPMNVSEEQKELFAKQVKDYHRFYSLTHQGDLYYILRPSINPSCSAWMFVSENKEEALFSFVVALQLPKWLLYIKLKGLKEDAMYYCEELDKSFTGDFLMNFGLSLNTFAKVDGASLQLYFKEVKNG